MCGGRRARRPRTCWHGLDLTRRVGEQRAYTDGTAVGINQRVDGFDLGSETSVRTSIQFQLDRLLQGQLALVTLGQAKVDIKGADVLKIDQVSTVFDIVAEVDVANPHHPGERCHDAHAIQPGTGQGQLRLGHLQTGRTLVKHTLRHKFLRNQLLVSRMVGLGNRHLGQRLLQFCALQGVIQLNQRLAGIHAGTIGESQRHDAAGNFWA